MKLYEENIRRGLLHGGILNEAWGKKGRPKKGEEQGSPNPSSKPKVVAKKQKEIKQPKPKSPPESVVLPYPPSNGSYYSRSQFLHLMTTHFRGKRNKIIDHLIANKLIPIKKTSVYKHLKDYEKDPEQYPMIMIGAPRDDLKFVAMTMPQMSRVTFFQIQEPMILPVYY
jgi:hypothetical protein